MSTTQFVLVGVVALLFGLGGIGVIYIELQKQYKRIDKMNEIKKGGFG